MQAMLLFWGALAAMPVDSVDKAKLEGVWKFEREIDTRPDGSSPIEIPGSRFTGLLIYRADGFMSVNIMPRTENGRRTLRR